MAMRIHHTIHIILSLSLLLLGFHELHIFMDSMINKKEISIIGHSSISDRPLRSRKVLASKFDFTPFQKDHQQGHENASAVMQVQKKQASEIEIDPRYGVEKRLVPTGPNPLHH